MEKIIPIFVAALISLSAKESTTHEALQKACLNCHTKQQIPSGMVYRRYLLKYSSKTVIREKIFAYLKAPSTETSIMPAPFFKKFPLKEASKLDDKMLKKLIDAYVQKYDVQKKIEISYEKKGASAT